MTTHPPIDDVMLNAFEADCARLDTNDSPEKAALVMMKYLGQAIARVRRAEADLAEARDLLGTSESLKVFHEANEVALLGVCQRMYEAHDRQDDDPSDEEWAALFEIMKDTVAKVRGDA